VNIIFDGDYKVNMDYAEGDFIGYLEIDPTFTVTSGNDGWFRDSNGDDVCSTANSSTINGSVLEPHIYGSPSANIDCQLAYIEFPVSGFPSTVTVTDVALDFYVTSVLSPDSCDVRPITNNQPSVSGSQTIFNEIMGATDYTQLTECQSTGQKSNMNLGSQAVTDFNNSITSGWFALGLKQDTDTVNANKITTIAAAAHSTYDPPKLTVTYIVPIAPQPPTGLTTVTGVPVELDWTAPTDNGGSAITGYKVFRTLNEYAANSAGIDFTNNEFLTHGFETVTTSTLTYEDDFTSDNFDTQGTKNQVNTGTGVIDFDFNRDGSNHKTKIDTTLGNEFVVRWTQTWDNIAFISGNPIGFIGLGNTAETVNIQSTTNDFLGFEIVVMNSGVVELRAVSAIGENINLSTQDDILTKSPAENETLGYEIIRYSDTDWEINIYDSTFTTLEDTTGLLTTASSSLDTTNFMVATFPTGSQSSQGDGTIDNLEIYNGVTTTDDVIVTSLNFTFR
jgi:hypothetical protein